jgi:histone arginine demethylase JMJD6
MQIKDVRRLKDVDPDNFCQEFLDSGPGEPVIVTDAMKHWEAAHWDFTFLRKRFEDKLLNIASSMKEAKRTRWIKMNEYLDYVENRESHPLRKLEGRTPFYAYTLKPFTKYSDLLNHFTTPYFIEKNDLYATLDPSMRTAMNPGWIMLGPENTVSALHQDFFSTHTWFGQICGEKRFHLFAPDQSDYLYGGHADPANPDYDRFPKLKDATVYVADVGPGEVLCQPAKWWHHVVSQSPSITLAFEFLSPGTFGPFLKEIFQGLPNAIGRFMSSPETREALQLNWQVRGFDFGEPGKPISPDKKMQSDTPAVAAVPSPLHLETLSYPTNRKGNNE